MASFETGRVCIKTKGSDKGRKCAVVEVIDQNFVLVDGDVKRGRCNIRHLEATSQKIAVKKGAGSQEVKAALK